MALGSIEFGTRSCDRHDALPPHTCHHDAIQQESGRLVAMELKRIDHDIADPRNPAVRGTFGKKVLISNLVGREYSALRARHPLLYPVFAEGA